jgi:hypothetical protein
LLTHPYRHSIAQSITTFKQPYAVLVDACGQVEDYAVTTGQSPGNFTNILRPFRELDIDRSLLKIIFAVTVFVADLAEWYENGSCLIDSLDLQKHASLLTYRLFDWYKQNEHGAIGGYTTANSLDQSVCLALLIFMVNATEPQAGSFGSRLSKVVEKLRQSLRYVPLSRWTNTTHLLLWILTMGALGAKSLPRSHKSPDDDPRLSFFKDHISLAFNCDGLSHPRVVDELLDRMQSCLWIPSVFNARVRLLWVSMGVREATMTGLDDISSSEGEQVDDEYALGQSTTLRFFTAEKRGTRKQSHLRRKQQPSSLYS